MFDLDMGQYGVFVWSAWGLSALVLAGLVVGVVSRARASARALRDIGDEAP